MNLSLETVLRCLDLVPLVRENQGIPLAELATRMNLDEKTIADQLIPALMLCGSPPYMPHDYINMWLEGDRVYVSFGDHFRRPVTLLPMEVTALHLALNGLRFDGIERKFAEQRVGELRAKIRSALPIEQREFLAEAERLCANANPPTPVLPVVNKAIAEKKKLRVDHLSTGETETKRRVIHPYGVVVEGGVNYLVCHDERRDQVLTFRIDRMHAVEETDEDFEVSSRFSLERFVKGGIFSSRGADETVVTANVTGPAARQVTDSWEERFWEWTSSTTLRVKLPTSRLRAAVRRVLALGPGAEIVSPPEARTVAAEELGEHLANYA